MIVAHGSPSAPWPQERAVRALACRVAAFVPGWRIEGATLAASGSLDSALKAVNDPHPLVYPLFMADGWFVSTRLRQLVGKILDGPAQFIAPFGTDPALHAAVATGLNRAATRAGYDPAETAVLFAAHGSPSDPRPGAAAQKAAAFVAARTGFREVRVGFIDEEPGIADAARIPGPAICLPFFASCGGHVQNDVPKALAEADFPGPMLEPVGLWPEVPELIARTLAAHAARLAA